MQRTEQFHTDHHLGDHRFQEQVHSLEKVQVDNGLVICSFRSIIKKLQEELTKLEQGLKGELAL